ncbi:HTH-type transcriptional regulator PuuR [Capillimicrobium parvum]|uniref:HTH-type transcriptional regulator PuuR n=1 Tax=Capillimicrobium parvum TaxID=2884022 RepID=A0A9E6Y2G3_9ACTN|nr:HTH-type transcriptional regulator PuuR [Capillimicrobium parvum]
MSAVDSPGGQIELSAYGTRLRSAREGLGVSVRSLARAVGVSPSLISQIEKGRANPSVGTLYGIVSALEISLDELFSETRETIGSAASADSRRSDQTVQRHADRPTVDLASGVRWERLTPMRDASVDFLLVTYDVGGASCPPDGLIRHSGREYGIVISGRLGATIGFETLELEAGDSLVVDCPTPHRFWTIGHEPAVAVWAIVGHAGDPPADFNS